MKQHIIAGTCALILSLCNNLLGDTITWTGAGDGLSWGDTNNWAGQILPGTADCVVVGDLGSNVVITATGDVVLQGLQCTGTLSLVSGSLRLGTNASFVTGDLLLATNTSLSLEGVGSSFRVDGAVSLNGASLTASGGAVLELAGLTQFDCAGRAISWRAEGEGSRLVLPGLTNIVSAGGYALNLAGRNGGSLEATNLVRTVDCPVNVTADGAGSRVDLSAWRSFDRETVPGAFVSLFAYNGGTLLVPVLGDEARVVLNYSNGGLIPVVPFTKLTGLWVERQAVNLPGVTNVDGTSLYAINYAEIVLPNVKSFDALCTGPSWQAVSGGRLALPGLTELHGVAGCRWLTLTVLDGGSIELTNVVALTNASLAASATGPGSVIDLSGLTVLAETNGFFFGAMAQAGGRIDLRQTESITGSSASLFAIGPGSVLDLSSLKTFVTPLAISSLTAQNDGAVLLGTNAALLQDVALNLPGRPVLSPTNAAEAPLLLLGQAWHSYQVDVQDTTSAESAWTLYKRVALTNDLQVIGDPPAPGLAFRLTEFAADPPIFELNPLSSGELQPVLFGLPAQAYRIESTDQLAPVDTVWSTWAETEPMTNSFRIFPAFSPDEPGRFFRAVTGF